MLQPSSEIQKRLDTYQTIDAVEAKALKLEWKRASRRHNAIMRTFAGLALTSVGISAYTHDVWDNQEIQAQASVTVTYEGAALDPANAYKGLVFIDGFGTDSADEITKYEGKAIQPVLDGQLLSVGYNNAPLETSDIAKEIIATAQARGINTISLVGHSAGGDVAMQVQEEIHKESPLAIESVVLLSTPDGVKTLRPARQDEIDLVQRVDWIPGVQYSSPIRFIGEMALRSGNYTNNNLTFSQKVSSFFTTANTVQTNLDNNKLPGMWLMFDQFLAIENANLEARINTMGELPNDVVRPTIVYLEIDDDPIVDNQQSSDNIATYAKKAAIPFLSYDISGAVHTRPDLNQGYIQTLAKAKDEIQSTIDTQESNASLNRVTSNYERPVIK